MTKSINSVTMFPLQEHILGAYSSVTDQVLYCNCTPVILLNLRTRLPANKNLELKGEKKKDKERELLHVSDLSDLD